MLDSNNNNQILETTVELVSFSHALEVEIGNVVNEPLLILVTGVWKSPKLEIHEFHL